MLAHDGVVVARPPLEERALPGVPSVPESDRDVSQQSAPRRALDRAATEPLLEGRVAEVGSDGPRPRLKGGPAGFETLGKQGLRAQGNRQNLGRDYGGAVHRLHDLGVMVNAARR